MLTDTRLRNINGKPYTGKPELTDRDGLSVRVSPNGLITFQYRYRIRGKAARVKLGRYPDLSVKDARAIIPELRLVIDAGDDPRHEWKAKKKEEIITVARCVDEFMRIRLPHLKPKSVQTYEGILNGHYKPAFKGRRIEKISHKDWLDWFDEKAKDSPKMAAALLRVGKTVFRWCNNRKLIPYLPILNIKTADVGVKPTAGTRVLTVRECRDIWQALDGSRGHQSTVTAIKLCMLWGCRQSEILNARIEHFDFNDMIWTVPEALSKTGKPIRRPITDKHKTLIDHLLSIYGESGYLIASPQKRDQRVSTTALTKIVHRIIEKTGMPHWRMHDFRRTISTRLSELEVMPHVTEKMLGHELGGVMAVYNKHDWLKDQREAYELWCEKVIPSPLLEYKKAGL